MASDLPLKTLSDCYARLLAICDELERVADSLPDRVDLAHCERLARDTVASLAQTHQREEVELLPLLAASSRVEFREMAERLRQDHEFDGQAAMEVEEALLGLAAQQPALSPDATGYLLRSFFESVRRHVHSEQYLLVLISHVNPPPGSVH
jgi:hypothetical protein